MRKIFLDIGTHNGQTLVKAMKEFTSFDWFVGVEPVKGLYDQAMKRVENQKSNKTVTIFNYALDKMQVPEKVITFYEDMGAGNNKFGSSILSDKRMSKNKKIEVRCVNVVDFFKNHFKDDDHIVMKIDIEGKEYDVFDALISNNMMTPVKTLFVEWHWKKVESITKEKHKDIVKRLRKLGYPMTGESRKDEYYNGKA